MRWHLLWLALPFGFWGCANIDVKGCGGLPDGTPCDDGNPCTENDTCIADFCQGFFKDCSFLDGECQSGVCDVETGECIVQDFVDGSPCTTGDFCIEGQTCQGGICSGGQERVCVALNPCQESFCNAEDGLCDTKPKTNGEPCDDGNACTGPGNTDRCVDGECAPGTPINCTLPPGLDSECAEVSCDPADNDGDPCFVSFINEGGPCNDNDPDTINTTCSQGFCGGGAPACAPDGAEPNDNANTAKPMVFGALSGVNICPSDADFHSFELILPGDSVAMEVRDAIGGCPFDSVLELRRQDGSLIVLDDNDGVGNCSTIAPAVDSGATNLQAGTFFAVVKGKTGNEQGAYVLEVETSTHHETEPNNTTGTADRHQLSSGPFRGRLSNASDVDVIRFEVNVRARLFAFLSNGANPAGCPFNAKLELLNSDGGVILSSSDGGFGGCPIIDTTFDPNHQTIGDLQPGTFFLRISGEGGQFGFYQLDAFLEAVEHESNNNAASAEGNPNNTSVGFNTGAIDLASLTANDVDFYRFVLTAPGSIAALTTGQGGNTCSTDTVLELRAANGTTVLASNDDINVNTNRCSLIDPNVLAGARNLAPGTYFLVVRGFNGSVTGNYRLEFAVQRPTESEPNGTTATADSIPALLPNQGSMVGLLSPFSVDMYRVEVSQGADLTIETSDGAGGCATDTVIELRNTNGLSTSILAIDDDDGVGLCSRISPTSDLGASNLPAGTYFIVVRPFNNASTSAEGSYVLSVTLTP